MKTTIWNKDNCKKYAHSKGSMNVAIDGRISFNSTALEILGFTEKSRFQFVQDSENLENWYIQPISSIRGFQINCVKNRAIFYNRALAIKILQSINAGTSAKFIISPHLYEEIYIPIITHSKEEKND